MTFAFPTLDSLPIDAAHADVMSAFRPFFCAAGRSAEGARQLRIIRWNAAKRAAHTGALVAVDTFFLGALKGVGKVYLQTAIDCHSRYGWARLYSWKPPVTAVHLMNTDVLPAFETYNAWIEVVRSDNGREYCGRPDQHPYELFLQLAQFEHHTTRV